MESNIPYPLQKLVFQASKTLLYPLGIGEKKKKTQLWTSWSCKRWGMRVQDLVNMYTYKLSTRSYSWKYYRGPLFCRIHYHFNRGWFQAISIKFTHRTLGVKSQWHKKKLNLNKKLKPRWWLKKIWFFYSLNHDPLYNYLVSQNPQYWQTRLHIIDIVFIIARYTTFWSLLE
jgi:hypothetical protein